MLTDARLHASPEGAALRRWGWMIRKAPNQGGARGQRVYGGGGLALQVKERNGNQSGLVDLAKYYEIVAQ